MYEAVSKSEWAQQFTPNWPERHFKRAAETSSMVLLLDGPSVDDPKALRHHKYTLEERWTEKIRNIKR